MTGADDAHARAAQDLAHSRQRPEQGRVVPTDHPSHLGGEQQVADQYQPAHPQAAMVGAVARGMDQIQGQPIDRQPLDG